MEKKKYETPEWELLKVEPGFSFLSTTGNIDDGSERDEGDY